MGERLVRNAGVAITSLAILIGSTRFLPAMADAALPPSRAIGELAPAATIHLAKTADWVAISEDAVWVGSTGPNAVHRIDPKTNRLVATVTLPGEPCAGLATGFGSLWVPLCAATPSLAKVDLAANRMTAVFAVGPAAAEGGVTTGAGSVWLMIDKSGTLARIDPESGAIRQTVRVPAGSYNPYFDGALTRIDVQTDQTTTIALGTPGHGGDISFGADKIWTTMPKVPLSMIDAKTGSLECRWAGRGGDSLGVAYDSIWLTDYHAGNILRFSLKGVLANCNSRR